jgi:selenocysteine-specific elongation factor
MTSCAVAVVGHVDHGKTALVKALTGQDTDRLDEEKARGLSITLGFAHRIYETGIVDFIDSPGHEDFIRAMVCGATGAQAALVVVSAVEGVERQTREHLQILHHLGVGCGVVAITKADLLRGAERSALKDQIAGALRGSPFADVPHILCSAKTRDGLDALDAALEDLVHRAPPPMPLAGAYLPVDRAFTVKGVGTVATGTLLGASMAPGDRAMVQPDGKAATVRRLQSRGDDVDIVRPGMRTAVNLRAVALEDLRRGDVICAAGPFKATREIDAWVELAPGTDPLKHGETVRLMIATASRVATVLVRGGRKLSAGEGGHARLRLGEAVTVHASQRGVLRRLSPAGTLGGIRVLDPAPPAGRRRDPALLPVLEAARTGGLADLACALAAHGRGVARLADLDRLSGEAPGTVAVLISAGFEILETGHAAPGRAVTEACAALFEAVGDALARQPALSAVPIADLYGALADRVAAPLVDLAARRLLADGRLAGDPGALTLPQRDPFSGLGPARRARIGKIERALVEGCLSPPPLAELAGHKGHDRDLIELLVASGRAVFLRNVSLKQTLVFHTQALDLAHGRLQGAFPPPTEFSMSQARAALETSRKYAIPLLEHFDKIGLTRRTGDVRCVIPREV